jgi:hypothetical protein
VKTLKKVCIVNPVQTTVFYGVKKVFWWEGVDGKNHL